MLRSKDMPAANPQSWPLTGFGMCAKFTGGVHYARYRA